MILFFIHKNSRAIEVSLETPLSGVQGSLTQNPFPTLIPSLNQLRCVDFRTGDRSVAEAAPETLHLDG